MAHFRQAPAYALKALAVCVGCVALAGAGTRSLQAQNRSPASLAEVTEAIAAQDRAIAGIEERLNTAAAEAEQARVAFDRSDEQMKRAVAAEIARVPQLRGLDHLLYDRRLPGEVARALPNRRQRLGEAEASLEQIRRDEELSRLAGLPGPNNSQRPLLEYVRGLFRGNIAWLEILEASLSRTQTARESRYTALRELRRTVSALKQAEDALRNAVRERYRLFHLLGTRFEPVHLRSLSVSLLGDRRPPNTWAYRAFVSQPPQIDELDRQIAFLLDQLDAAEEALIARRTDFLNAEARFIDVGERWQAAHARYSDLITHSYYLRIGLELTDAAIGTLRKGGTPAGLFFEAAWRVGEAKLTDFRIEEPKLDAALIAHRDEVAHRLADFTRELAPDQLLNDEQWLAANRHALANTRGFFTRENLDQHIRGEQASEFVKGVANTAVIDGIQLFAQIGVDLNLGRNAMARFLEAEIFQSGATRKNLELFRNKVADLLPEGISRWLRSRDVAGEVVESVKQSWAAEKGADFLIAAGVTAVKAGLTTIQQRRVAQAAFEVAMLDIEWLLRRHEYSARGAIYRAMGLKLAEAEAAIGALIERRANISPDRPFSIEAAETISTTDILRIHLEFSAPVDLVTLSAGGKQFTHSADKAKAVFDIPQGAFPAGALPLAVTATINRLGPEFGFDADPATVARYEPKAAGGTPSLAGFERGADQRHTLALAEPRIEIVDPKPGGYLPGDWIDLTCQLPGSLQRRDMFLTAAPVQQPHRVALQKTAEAAARFPAPPKAGPYTLLLFSSGRTEPHAEVSFTVPFRVAAEVGKSRFVRVLAVPLADRGPTFNLPQDPPPPGLGRLTFETRDAAAQLVQPRISLRKAGKELTYTYGSRSIDLAPDGYEAVIHFPVPISMQTAVTAGQTNIILTSGHGRLTFDVRDALGKPITPRLSIRHAGQDKELVYTYGQSSLDLPPGAYDVVINAVPNIEHGGVVIDAGRETIVTTDGYGRLQLNALDGLGKPSTPRVSIKLAGKDAEFAYTYGGSYIDLPPDTYQVAFAYTPRIEFKNVVVEAGKVATRTAQGYGRLQLNVFNAQGAPITSRVSIKRPGQDREISYGYGGSSVDLPPGPYICVLGSGENQVTASAVVTPGMQSSVTLRGR